MLFKKEFFKDARFYVIIALFLTGLFDILTTVLGRHQLEINPIFILSQSWIIMIIVKLFGLGLMTYFVLKINGFAHVAKYMICFGLFFMIGMQLYAGISNIKVSNEVSSDAPGYKTIQEKLDAVNNYNRTMLLLYIYPMIIGTGSFLFYRIFEIQRIKRLSDFNNREREKQQTN